MDIRTLDWDPFLLQFFDVPRTILPQIRSSAELFGRLRLSRLADGGGAGDGCGGVPIAGCLGDQQAALLGQHCLAVGQAKATYGTGCFLLAKACSPRWPLGWGPRSRPTMLWRGVLGRPAPPWTGFARSALTPMLVPVPVPWADQLQLVGVGPH